MSKYSVIKWLGGPEWAVVRRDSKKDPGTVLHIADSKTHARQWLDRNTFKVVSTSHIPSGSIKPL